MSQLKEKAAGAGDCFVGIQVSATRIRAGVFNAAMQCQGKAKTSVKINRGAQEILERTARCAQDAVDEADLDWTTVKAVGLGATAVQDCETGLARLETCEVRFKPDLEKLLRRPVYVEKDGNLASLASLITELDPKPANLLGVFIGGNISAGYIVDGKISDQYASLTDGLEHLSVQAEGAVCSCGKKGCLYSLASRPAIIRQIQAASEQGKPTVLAEFADGNWNELRSNVLRKAMKRDDALVAATVAQAARHIGIAVAHLTLIIKPQTIVLGGRIPDLFTQKVKESVRQIVHERMTAATAVPCTLVFSQLENDAVTTGGALWAKQQSVTQL